MTITQQVLYCLGASKPRLWPRLRSCGAEAALADVFRATILCIPHPNRGRTAQVSDPAKGDNVGLVFPRSGEPPSGFAATT
jgi:hypothetical protein